MTPRGFQFNFRLVIRGTGFFPSTSVFPVSIIPPILHTFISLILLLSEGQAGEACERSNKAVLCVGSTGQKTARNLTQFLVFNVLTLQNSGLRLTNNYN